jgi:predicted hydrocarbon binding protein
MVDWRPAPNALVRAGRSDRMDNSTAGVTLLNGFVTDILAEYQHLKRVCGPAFELAKGVDRSRPTDYCSIDIYNDVCTWIEQNVGEMSIRQAGIAIGRRVAANIIEQGKMTSPTPIAMMEALKWAASVMIKDPKGRGWEILDQNDHSITMRRTQTFNCKMQEGLLVSLVEKTGVEGADVEHAKCTKRGDEFCEYRLSWL